MNGKTQMSKLEKTPDWCVSKLTSANQNTTPTGSFQVGSRNNDLTSYAGYLRRKYGFDKDQLFEKLKQQNSTLEAPLPKGEVRAIATSIAKYASIGLSTYDDIPLSRELASHLAPTTRNAEALGWMTYTGKAWAPDVTGGIVQESAKKFAELIYESAKSNSNHVDDAAKRARSILAASKVAKAVALASSDDLLRCKASDFDAKPNMLNLQNGTLDLATQVLRGHQPDDLITKLAHASYDPEATCPHFDKLLQDSLPLEHQKFALRLFGYSLLGVPDKQIFILFYGPGANGKSTLVNAVTYALGDYAANAEPSTFIKQKNPGIRNDLARLKGARMVATSELATGEILDAPLVKRITGGDPITARYLHKELFEYDPQFVMFMTTNALPVINGADAAMARRIVLVPFKNVIPEKGRDSALPEKLKAEASGIMNRLLEGLRDFMENGLSIPADLKTEADKYAQSSDMILGFLEDSCVIEHQGSVASNVLRIYYNMWCGENGLKPLSQPQFKAEMMKKTGLSPIRKNSGVVWPGLSVRRPSM